jgi:hypothetical protein
MTMVRDRPEQLLSPIMSKPLPDTAPKRKLVIQEPAPARTRVSFSEMRTPVNARLCYLIPLLGAAATAAGIAATPPAAAANCVSAAGPDPLTLCSQGESRVSNRTTLPRATPYIPLDCDVDWLCDQGLGIALGD